MVFVDGDSHLRLRRLVSRAFTPARVDKLSHQIAELSDDLLRAAMAKDSFDFIADFALPLPLQVIAKMLGLNEDERQEFHEIAHGLLDTATPIQMVMDSFNMYRRYRFLRRLIERKRDQPGHDLTSALIAVECEGERLSFKELLGTIFLLLFAGHETTVSVLGSGTLLLLRHREQLARLVAEPRLLSTAFEEMLRMSSPSQLGMPRFVTEETELGGQRLQRGDVVLPFVGAANFDAAVFEDPERFDVGRTPNPHLALGAGPHFCMGAHLARLEGRLAFERIVPMLDEVELACEVDQLQWRQFSGGLRGLEALPLKRRAR